MGSTPDSRCARIIVDDAQEAVFTPYGFDIFGSLSSLCDEFAEELETELHALSNALPPLDNYPDGSRVHAILDGIGKKRDPSADEIAERELRGLAKLSGEEKSKRQEYASILHVQKSPERTKLANEARRSVQRSQALLESLEKMRAVLTKDRIVEIVALIRERKTAATASKVAAEELTSQSELAGVGSDVWKELYEAARRYSERQAYPNDAFPYLQDDALCVLCQQSLADPAKARFKSFEQFMREDANDTLKRTAAELEERVSALNLAKTTAIQITDESIEEIGEQNESFGTSLRSFKRDFPRFIDSLIEAIASENPEFHAPEPHVPTEEAKEFQLTLQKRQEEVESSMSVDELKQLELLHSELDARHSLEQNPSALLAFTRSLTQASKLNEAIQSLNTRKITTAAGKISNKVVTQELEQSLNAELRSIGLERLELNYKRSGTKGQISHKITLGSLAGSRVAPTRILSEGEQCCVAIASFLAELHAANHGGGIIFDDPVSSLDHEFREKIAERLAEEAVSRQIIVFTHDIVFFKMLEIYCGETGIEPTQQQIRRYGDKIGESDDSIPWIAMNVNKRVKFLRKKQQAAQALYKNGEIDEYEEKGSFIYGRLRETWERAVEEILFQGAIGRFSSEIQTKKLKKISKIEDVDVAALNSGMTKCSKWLPGHDQPEADNSPFPSPNEILDDINKLDDLRKRHNPG